VNKVLLTGRLTVKPDVAYTPKGGRILRFPLWVEDGGFNIEVVYLDRAGINDPAGMTGAAVVVSGALMKSKDTKEPFKLKAQKIIWMEE
jgi:hypothetical protein